MHQVMAGAIFGYQGYVTTAGILYQVTEFLLEDECAETVVIVMLRCA